MKIEIIVFKQMYEISISSSGICFIIAAKPSVFYKGIKNIPGQKKRRGKGENDEVARFRVARRPSFLGLGEGWARDNLKMKPGQKISKTGTRPGNFFGNF